MYNFTNDPIFFTGLASEPGARSMNVSIWGYRDSFLSQYWVSITIDFRELLTRDCKSALLEVKLMKNVSVNCAHTRLDKYMFKYLVIPMLICNKNYLHY